jgi:alkylation response protein AidB-like acyl-CoA dehydrogenase
MAYPDEATSPSAGIILLLPREAKGRTVDPNWDVLGMRATRSDSLILDDCWLPESAAVYRSDDTRPFRHTYLNWFWGSYTPVYLGIAQAAFDELRRVMHARQPEGYAQPLAYHSDVRRHVAEMSADLEAARLITYRSAWLSDTQGEESLILLMTVAHELSDEFPMEVQRFANRGEADFCIAPV